MDSWSLASSEDFMHIVFMDVHSDFATQRPVRKSKLLVAPPNPDSFTIVDYYRPASPFVNVLNDEELQIFVPEKCDDDQNILEFKLERYAAELAQQNELQSRPDSFKLRDTQKNRSTRRRYRTLLQLSAVDSNNNASVVPDSSASLPLQNIDDLISINDDSFFEDFVKPEEDG